MKDSINGLLDFGLSQEKLQKLEESSSSVVCEGGGEGWDG